MQKEIGLDNNRALGKELCHVAMKERNWSKAIELLEAAPPNALSKAVLTELLTSFCLFVQPKAVKAAMAAGARPRKTWMFDMACWLERDESVEDWKECVMAVAGGGMGKLNARNLYGRTGLHHALRENHWEWAGAAMALLDLGVDPWKKTADGEDASTLAVRYGHVEVYRKIKGMASKKGVEISAKMKDACESRNPAMVALALSEGGDPAGSCLTVVDGPMSCLTVVDGPMSFVNMAKRKPGQGIVLADSAEGRPDGNPEILSMLRSACEAKKIRASLGKKDPKAGWGKKPSL